MADLFLSYAGIGCNAATFKVDDATFEKIKEDLDAAKGKGVALTANDTVGFGAEAGSPLFGFIEKVDMRKLATVMFSGFAEDAPLAAAKPALGEVGLGVDAAGAVMKLAVGKRGVVTALGDYAVTVLL